MRILLRSISVLTLGIALVALIARRDDLSRVTPPFAPEVAIVLLTGIIGLVAAWSRRRQEPMEPETIFDLPRHQSETPIPQPTSAIEERAVLTFAKQLLGATATDELRAIVESQLPVLLQGRKVWIASGNQARVEASAPGDDERTPVLGDEVQEWTTFALRLGADRVGLLGVESSGGLSPELKSRLQSITPLIAQAVRTAQEVDVFRQASVVDLLTGAATRREGLNRLQAEVKRAQRTGSAMAVLMIDLDHFKSINDGFGHAVGDTLLTAIGQTMVRSLRASDVRCRWGGEEFLIVLPDTSLAQAQIVATNLLQNVAATTVASAKGPVSSTASIGLTVSRPSETDVSRIVGRADMALYQAKHAGRACIRVVLGGFDGEPVADGPRKPVAAQTNETLPFPDRRNPHRADRRGVRGPGRRRTDTGQPPATDSLDDLFNPGRRTGTR